MEDTSNPGIPEKDSSIAHPASWEGDKISLRDCIFETSDHPASVKVVDKDEKIALEKKSEGNELFSAKKFAEAIELYTEALEYAPLTKDFDKQRAIFYANRGACCLELGRHKEAVEDCTKALESDEKYVKALIRRAKAHEALDQLDECLADMNAVLEIDPKQPKLRQEREKMEQRVKEKHEKLKEEMLGTLKDLGNKFLGYFGMSTDNFKLNQDPATGAYSVNFQQ